VAHLASVAGTPSVYVIIGAVLLIRTGAITRLVGAV
jgi:hypothetical protein